MEGTRVLLLCEYAQFTPCKEGKLYRAQIVEERYRVYIETEVGIIAYSLSRMKEYFKVLPDSKLIRTMYGF